MNAKKTIVGLQLALCEVQQTTYLRRIVRPRRKLQLTLLTIEGKARYIDGTGDFQHAAESPKHVAVAADNH